MTNVQLNPALSNISSYPMRSTEKTSNVNNVEVKAPEVKTLQVASEKSTAPVESSNSLSTSDIKKAGSFFSRVKDSVLSAKEKIQNVASTAITVATKVVNTATKIGSAVAEKATNIYNAVSKSATVITDAVSEGVKNSEKLKEAAKNMAAAATSLVANGTKTAVSIGADVAKIAGLVTSGVAKIAEGYNSGQGIIDKVSKMYQGAKSLAEIKDPLVNIKNTFTTGTTEMKRNYEDLKTNFEIAKNESQALKKAIVTVGKEVKETASYVKAELVDGSNKIRDAFNSYNSNVAFA